MPRILLVTSSYPRTHSGREAAGSFVHDFAVALSARARVTVVAPAAAQAAEGDGNLAVRRFAVPRLPLSLLRARRPDHWRAIAATLRAGAGAVEAAVADGTDHVLALWVLPCGYWAARSARRHGVPYSTWALGSDIWSLSDVPLVRGVLRRVLAGARYRFADGVMLAGDVERLCGRTCEFMASARRLPLPRPAAFRKSPPYRLAYLGRWHPNKGVDLLLDALGELDERHWARIEAVRICGGGPQEALVKTGCARLAAAGRPVEAGGYLDKDAAADLLAWADYVLIPSRIESIPVILSDAVQAGCPVIASPVGDLPAVVRDLGIGVVAEAVSAGAFARALAGAIDAGPAACAGHWDAALAKFDVEAAAARFMERIG